MAKTFEDFLEALAQKESGGKYNIENYSGYLGKYQMGELALIDAGYYLRDGTKSYKNSKGQWIDNDWIGKWTGRKNIKSKSGFLKSSDAQEDAIRNHVRNVWKQIKALHLTKYEANTFNGITMTKSGMIAGAHLTGIGRLRKYLLSAGKIVPKDGNNTSIEHYIKKFGGYEVDSFLNSKSNAVKSGKITKKLPARIVEGQAVQVLNSRFEQKRLPKSNYFKKMIRLLKQRPDETFPDWYGKNGWVTKVRSRFTWFRR